MKSHTPNRAPSREEADPIDRLLEAERRVEEDVGECRLRAEQRLQEARRQAHHIFKRTHKRITTIHSRCAEALEEQVQALWDEFHAEEGAAAGIRTSQKQLHSAVEVIAARLTGDDHV